MGLSEDEQSSLTIFGNLKLDRIQTETIVGRKISSNEWRRIQNKKVKSIRNLIAQNKLNILEPFGNQLKNLIVHRILRMTKSIRADRYNKLYKSVAQDVANVGYRKQFKTNIEDEPNRFHFVKLLFPESP